MNQVILYIEGQRLELFNDETVSLTQTIQNVKDIGSIFTDFSKAFSVPASPTNNKVFKHYYNFEITNGFNANDKKPAEIYLNSILFRKGFIALDGVKMEYNRPASYRLTFFGETVDLKKKLKEVTLQNVFEGTSAYNYDYNIANVKAGLETNVPGITDVIYPLISHTNRFIYDSATNVSGSSNLKYVQGTNKGVDYSDLKPAIKLTAILERITAYTELENGVGNGLVFDLTGNSFFNTTVNDANYNKTYDQMFLWLARSKGVIGKSYTGSSLNTIVLTSMTNPNSGWNAFCYRFQTSYPACENSKITDAVWRIKPVFIQAFNRPSLDFAVEWKVVGSGGGTFTLAIEDITGQTTPIASATNLAADGSTQHIITTGYLGTVGQFSNIRFVLTATSGQFTYTTNLILEKRFGEEVQNNPVRQYTYAYCDITDVFPKGSLEKVVVADQMPQLLVLQYLTGLFKMFNLTAFVQDNGNIKVQTLDSFYENGSNIDITDNLVIDKAAIDFPIPYEEIAFRNVPPKTLFATNFAELNNTIYGNLENATSVQGIEQTDRGSKYVVQTPFEKIVYERLIDETGNQGGPQETFIGWGWSVDKDERPILTAPMIFINENQSASTTPISFIDGVSQGNPSSVTTYNRPSNSLIVAASASGGLTINFGAEVDEYTGAVKLGSLFQSYYFNYISGVFNQSRRLTKVDAVLPLKFLANYSLADTLILNQRKYNINSITTNLQTGKSQLQLFNKIVL